MHLLLPIYIKLDPLPSENFNWPKYRVYYGMVQEYIEGTEPLVSFPHQEPLDIDYNEAVMVVDCTPDGVPILIRRPQRRAV